MVGQPLLETRALVKDFPARAGLLGLRRTAVRAVDGVDLTVEAGKTLALVGESGSGKTTTARMVTGLLPPTSGRITFDGDDVWRGGRRVPGRPRNEIQMIFQSPYSSLNPRRTAGASIAMPLRAAGRHDRTHLRRRVREMLDLVGLAADCADRYPHELSGGQRQRVGIARALIVNPRLVVADEPVAALDVSVQAQIINLLGELQRELGIAYVLVAHDLAVVRRLADRVAIMYQGRIVEIGDPHAIYHHPTHPYTAALLSAVPDLDGARTPRSPSRRTPPTG